MLPQSLGIPIVVVCVALFAAAYRFARGGGSRTRAALICILLAGALLRLFACGDQFLHEWDERYHALVAKNTIDSPLRPTLYKTALLDYDYRDFFSNHVWVHKPPLTLWLMAISIKTFGVHELAVRLPSLLFGTLAIALTFFLGKRLFDERVALLAAGLHAINGLLLELGAGRTATDHPDALMIFFVTLGAYSAVRAAEPAHTRARGIAWLAALGICTGLAILTKWMVAMIIPALWVVLAWRTISARRFVTSLAIVLGAAAAVALPWNLYIWRAFPREAAWESHYNLLHVLEPLGGHGQPAWWYLRRIGRDFGEAIYIPVAWFLIARAARGLGRRWIFLLVWFLTPYAVFSISATKMPGYVAISSSALFLIIALFCAHVTAAARNAAPPPRAKFVRLAATLLLVLALGLPARYAIERLRLSPKRERTRVWADELRALDARYPDPRAVFFNCERPIEAMFYGSHIAYARVPTAAEIASLEAQGYRAVVLESGVGGAARATSSSGPPASTE
ncbi:MAG: ArnT family glycosyltransferase [bacterium]